MPTMMTKNLVFAGAGLLVVIGLATAMVLFRAKPGDSPSAPRPAVDMQAIQSKAERGDAAAQNALGGLYEKGQGVPQSFPDAFKWYRSAAEQGLADAQYNLGVLYETGQGATRDEVEAAKWQRKAADQGHAGAQYDLAAMYATGRGVPRDATEAAKLYRPAAEQGDVLAQYNLARRYEVGQGVPVDRVEAYKWHKLAAAQGLDDAANRLTILKGQLTEEQIAEGERRAKGFRVRKPGAAISN